MKVGLAEEPFAFLIEAHPTGVVYSAQTGGHCCGHPEIEGAIVSVADDRDNDFGQVMCDLSCGSDVDWTTKRIAQANTALGALVWCGLAHIEAVTLDPERLAESHEGWWLVTWNVREYSHDTTWQIKETVTVHRGVVCGPNCD